MTNLYFLANGLFELSMCFLTERFEYYTYLNNYYTVKLQMRMNLPISFAHSLLFMTLVLLVVLIGFNNNYFIRANAAVYEQLPIINNDPNLKTELVFKGLKFPTSMAFLGPNDILVLEKNNGTVKRIVNGTMLPKPLLNVNAATEGGRGMLGINVDRHEKDDPAYVFLYFIELSGEKDHEPETGGKARLYRYELKDDMLTNPKLLIDASGARGVGNHPDEFHNGGKILIGPDQNIYLVVGQFRDRHTATMNIKGHELPDGNSGILRVTLDGKPIKGGNILGDGDPLNKYFAYGIRNSFGMDFDPVTGTLWDTENGPEFGDEINLVRPGFNSGFSIVQGIWYLDQKNHEMAGDIAPLKPKQLVDFGGKGKYSPPEFTWYHPVGPTALKFLNSDKLGKQYENDLFVGDTGGNIYHFQLNQKRTALSLNGSLADKVADTNAENKDIAFGSGFKTITDMQVGPDGYLYILDYHLGAIFRIVPIQSLVPIKSIINLLDEKHIWRPFRDAIISQSDGTLTINVDTNNTKKIYNRALLQTHINWTECKPLRLNLDYASESLKGNATFLAQIRENPDVDATNKSNNVLWSSQLHNTLGKLTNETFILSPEIANKPVEFRLYIITEEEGQHTLTIKKANIVHQ
jgi:aldose sugar dehydrogenase